jgi:GNAT superfamily N-acetyltransferase
VIRSATHDEVPALVAAYEWLFAPPGSRPAMWDAERAAERLSALIAGDGGVFVADQEGAVVGICTVTLDIESVRFGPRAWVEDLAVHPDHRSAGHGKALLDAAKDWGRERGATHLELDSGEARADAHRFYERERPSWKSTCFGWEL